MDYNESMENILRMASYYNSILRVLEWDADFFLASSDDSVNFRSETYNFFLNQLYEMVLSENVENILNNIDLNKLDEVSKVCFEKLKYYNNCYKIMRDSSFLLEERQKIIMGFDFRNAVRQNDFSLVSNSFNKYVNIKIKNSEKISESNSMYQNEINQYISKITILELDVLFNQVIEFIKIKTNNQYYYEYSDSEVIMKNYKLSNADNKIIIDSLLSKLGFNFEKGTCINDMFPSCTKIGARDIRITVPNNFELNLLITACMHEFGHAIYLQNTDEKLDEKMLGEASSTVLDEAVAKIFENHICKSKAFSKFLIKNYKKYFADQGIENYNQLFKYLNSANNKLIRIKSDECSFNVHIYIRYLIEKEIFCESSEVANIERLWGDKYRSFFGVREIADKEGILQDPHWFNGKFGYFPSYFIANLYAAQIYSAMEMQIEDINHKISEGDFNTIIDWLTSKIFIFGKAKSDTKLLLDVTGEELNSKYYLDYLENKLEELSDN